MPHFGNSDQGFNEPTDTGPEYDNIQQMLAAIFGKGQQGPTSPTVGIGGPPATPRGIQAGPIPNASPISTPGPIDVAPLSGNQGAVGASPVPQFPTPPKRPIPLGGQHSIGQVNSSPGFDPTQAAIPLPQGQQNPIGRIAMQGQEAGKSALLEQLLQQITDAASANRLVASR